MTHQDQNDTVSTSSALVEGVAWTLRRLELDIAARGDQESSSATRRLTTFQRTLAKALQAAHLETVQEFAGG